jgi:hypothetical protein
MTGRFFSSDEDFFHPKGDYGRLFLQPNFLPRHRKRVSFVIRWKILDQSPVSPSSRTFDPTYTTLPFWSFGICVEVSSGLTAASSATRGQGKNDISPARILGPLQRFVK